MPRKHVYVPYDVAIVGGGVAGVWRGCTQRIDCCCAAPACAWRVAVGFPGCRSNNYVLPTAPAACIGSSPLTAIIAELHMC